MPIRQYKGLAPGILATVMTQTADFFTTTGSLLWSAIDKTGSSLADLTTRAEADLTFTDITTNNVSTTKHGFTPKLPNDATKFLDGTGAYDTIDHTQATNIGTNTHAQIDTHIGSTSNPHSVTLEQARTAGALLEGSVTFVKTSGIGIKIDTSAPVFGFRDIIGRVTERTGASNPIFAAFRGSVYAYSFTTGPAKEAFVYLHIPHDYVPGTDIYLHTHWGQNVVDTGGLAGVPGDVKWYFDFTYADGHGTAGGAADPFVAPLTQSVTQQASTTQYGHMIAEVAITNDGGDATHIDRNTILPDGLLIIRCYRDAADVADTLDQVPFLFFVDAHYQSTNLATKNKAPDFYA